MDELEKEIEFYRCELEALFIQKRAGRRCSEEMLKISRILDSLLEKQAVQNKNNCITPPPKQ